jgi:signal transduction histidine kinase
VDSEQGSEHPRGLRLDGLLDELQVQVDAVRGSRDRLRGLLEALLSLGRELDLLQVLRHIVETAMVLVDAEYGALGVLGEGARLARFLPVGVTLEQVKAIGPLPSGHGVLGEVIRHPQPLRLRELADHPASCGFPANHPPMHSFLGAPVRVGDEVFGNLYLTEKRGGGEFDAEDEAMLATLAVAAGVAIDNARVYEETRRRQRLVEANAEVTRALLSGEDEAVVLEMIVGHARDILAADLGALALPCADGGHVRVALAVGVDAEIHDGLVLPCEGSFVGAAFTSTGPITSTHVPTDPRITVGPPRWQGLGPAVAVPMRTAEGVRGVLLLARAEGEAPFTPAETAPLLGFAAQAALAMTLAGRRRDAEQIALFEERDRIARDLHDLAIQRLFATGMTLQGAVRLTDHPEAVDRLRRAVKELDDTIKIIRSTIFGLRTHETGAAEGLRARTATAVGEAAEGLGFTPVLRMEGLLDTDVPRAVADDVVAALVEALSNVARHAQADAVDVSLVVQDGRLTLTVTDDGVGLAPGRPHRGGLRNLAERAMLLGGELTAEPAPEGGTRLHWCVPLRQG